MGKGRMAKIYLVDGMTCGGCSGSVTKAIEGLATGVSVSVDLENKKVTVEGLEDDNAVKQAVEDAGFDFKGAA